MHAYILSDLLIFCIAYTLLIKYKTVLCVLDRTTSESHNSTQQQLI